MDKKLKRRVAFIQFLLLLCIALLGLKSFDVQIFQGGDLRKKAEKGYSRHLTIKGERGQILDRHLSKLGDSIDAPTITADPSRIQNPSATAAKLSPILGKDKKKIKARLSRQGRYTVIASKVTPEQAARVRALKLKGIYIQNDSKRFYPNRSLAAQVIGFTGRSDSGLEGLEYKHNAILEGRTIKVRIRRDGAGRILTNNNLGKGELKGNSIVLTIDKKIQFLSEKALEKAVKTNQAKSGMALVMEPKTGEILAMAHYPGFNPNNYSSYSKDRYRNRAATDTFEPGSIMKIFTVAAALEKGVMPKSIFFCENGKYPIGRYVVNDTKPHDWLSLGQILKYSSNIGAVKIVETIGSKALHDHLTAFGFGAKTRLGSPGESSGSLLAHQKWTRMDAGAISFGQGVSVSAIQLIAGVSAVANNGKLMKPILIKKIVSNSGKDIKVFEPLVIRQAVSPKTAGLVKQMMHQTVLGEGTGILAAMDGYRVCGKTSTAQKAGQTRRGYDKNKYIASFAGFAPRDNPKLAILVVVNEPKKDHYGGIVAAPAFKTIMAKSFNYLNIPPENTRSMIASLSKEEKP